MSNADNSDFTPTADVSEESSSLDQETLVEVAEKKHAADVAGKKRSAAPKAAKPLKKNRAKNTGTTTST